MHDSTDEFLRRALAGRAAPRVAGTFATSILARVALDERARRVRSRLATRVLLGICWLAVGGGSAWIFWSTRWPVWTPSAGALSGWLVPLACAVLLWHAAFINWLGTWCRRLLQVGARPDLQELDQRGARS
jgi:hypothetical protein